MLNTVEARNKRDDAFFNGQLKTKGEWQAAAYNMLCEYARLAKRRRRSFKVEDVREYAMNKGMKEAHDDRAWGGIAVRARNDGLIARIGYSPARSSNMSPKTLWVSL